MRLMSVAVASRGGALGLGGREQTNAPTSRGQTRTRLTARFGSGPASMVSTLLVANLAACSVQASCSRRGRRRLTRNAMARGHARPRPEPRLILPLHFVAP